MAGDRPSAVRLFAPERPALSNSLRSKLERRQADLIAQLTSAQDWADFKQRVGVLAGLGEAVAFCHDAEKDLNGE